MHRGVDRDLILASTNGNAARIREHLRHGASADAVDRDGDSALSLAALSNRAEAVQVLLDAKASPDQTAPGRVSALERAIKEGNAQIVGALLDAGASPHYRGIAAPKDAFERNAKSPMQMAIDKNSKNMSKWSGETLHLKRITCCKKSWKKD